MQRISITLDDTLKHQLDNAIPKGERARFVADAIQKALEDWQRKQALDMLNNIRRFKVQGDSVEMLRKIREERADYLATRHQPEPQA
jgi:metal-responsive CopG/Arc/MetJ family transcriptional regulator